MREIVRAAALIMRATGERWSALLAREDLSERELEAAWAEDAELLCAALGNARRRVRALGQVAVRLRARAKWVSELHLPHPGHLPRPALPAPVATASAREAHERLRQRVDLIVVGLATLFAEDATYRTAPFEEPFRGLGAISAMWEDGRDGPDEAFELESEVVAVEGDVGVVRLEVRYGEPASQTYRDLWLVRLDDEGRCTAFEEWPFWPPGSEGEFARPPELSRVSARAGGSAR